MTDRAFAAGASGAGIGQAGERAEDALLGIAQDLARELRPGRRLPRADLDASLERDWSFDSLSRAELFMRVERAFGASLPERLLGEAQTLRDLLDALARARKKRPSPAASALAPVRAEAAEPAPLDLATLTAVLDWHAGRHGERRHLVIEQDDEHEIPLSYRTLAEGAQRAALGLRRIGVEPGDRVGIMLPTGEDFFIAFFAVLYAGATPAPIYPPARIAQIGEHLRRQAGILRNAGAVVLIADAAARPATRLLRMQVDSLRSIETIEGLATETGGSLPQPTAQDAALLQYTSGSTGDPKGVLLTHANLLANIRAMGAVIAPTASDVFVSWLPLYHDMGLIGAWLGSLHYGVPLVVMSPLRFLVRPERWLWAIHRRRGTLSAAPNFAFELCLRKIADEALAGLDLSSLRMVANGAEPVSADTIRAFTARFARWGFRAEAMAPVYGLAENAVGLAFPPLGRRPPIDRIDRRALSRTGRAAPVAEDVADALEFVACGRPIPGHQVRILGASGELGEREEGRLQFRGPSATSGYFRNPDKNRELFDGEWLNSGDLAYIAAGDIFVTGRSKDIIIRAGQHIYPQEVEEAVGEAPGVRKGCVAVFGVTDPRAGTERLVVLAETRESDPARLAGIRRGIEEAATPLLQTPPEEIILAPPHTVPKTSSGKIRRAAARDLYEQGRLGAARRALWRQIASLAAAGSVSRLRVARRTVSEFAYAGYWWAVMAGFGLVAWPLTLALPGQARRWAVLHRLARLALRLVGSGLSVERAAALPERAILVSNHASYLDGLVLAAALPGELAFVAKKELERQHVAGPFLRALGALFVERGAPEAGVEGAREALTAAQAGRRVIIFPEGTFTRAPGLLPFRLGAFSIAVQASLPVVPIAIRGARSALRGEQWLPRRSAISVHIGAPIAPEGQDFAAVIRLRDAVRAAILAECGEPETAET